MIPFPSVHFVLDELIWRKYLGLVELVAYPRWSMSRIWLEVCTWVTKM